MRCNSPERELQLNSVVAGVDEMYQYWESYSWTLWLQEWMRCNSPERELQLNSVVAGVDEMQQSWERAAAESCGCRRVWAVAVLRVELCGCRSGWNVPVLRELLLNSVVAGVDEMKECWESYCWTLWLQEWMRCNSAERVTVELCGCRSGWDATVLRELQLNSGCRGGWDATVLRVELCGCRRGWYEDPGCCCPVTAGGSGNWDGAWCHRECGVNKASFPVFTQVSLLLLFCFCQCGLNADSNNNDKNDKNDNNNGNNDDNNNSHF